MHLPNDQYAAANRRQTRTAEGRRRVPQNLAVVDPSMGSIAGERNGAHLQNT